MYISDLEYEYYRTEDGYKQYLTTKPLICELDNGDTIIVPANFKSDLASIPRPFHHWVKRDNAKYTKSVILHDMMYSEKRQFKRNYADKILYKAMRCENAPLRYCLFFYIMVRLGGWYRYYFK